jgi:mannose-6-phosphate isomerase class I
MLKPFFDPGPWGGHWMEEVCDLDRTAPNYAWCFNCVPEENSLLIRIGDTTFETPALNLIFRHPDQVLGPGVHQRFGAEFPIRFDFLDTMGGGNLSLQVHPTKQYIQQQFGIPYTQDESYYLMAAEPGAKVYLGLRDHVDPGRMREALEHAQEGKASFPADDFAASFPVRKHDHVSIPAGTLHCSGKDAVVLEISATPYIFTFKLWDWGRMGLDGKPRPIHLDHGMNVLASDRTESWVRENLLSLVEDVGSGIGWREQRTGLHALEFIETRRHWFTGPVPHNTYGTVNVLTLVEGESIVVESPGGTFDPLVMRYAETIVVPASVGPYVIRPQHSSPLSELATLKAYVRDSVHGIYGS